MDFSKFSASPAGSEIGSYVPLKGTRIEFRGYELSPIHMNDRVSIMKWRNEQIACLNQSTPLDTAQQDSYFNDVVKPNFSKAKPDLILLRVSLNKELIGYTSISHFNWQNLHARVFFLLDTERVRDAFQYGTDCSVILNLLMRICFKSLNLNKMSMYSHAHRGFHVNAVEASGMKKEGVLREHVKVDGKWTNVVVASCLKSDFLRQYPQ